MDKKFTRSIQDWLSTPQDERSLSEGADLLLRLNRNRWMHQQILRRELWDKLEYELRKHLGIRSHGLTMDGAAAYEQRVLSAAAERLAAATPEGQHHGLRPDHDSLPAAVRLIPETNARLFHKLKALFEGLKKREKEQPCDRHEDVYQLAMIDEQIRKGWETYDHALPAAETEAAEAAPAAPAVTASQVSAARKYLSTNAKKLSALIEEGAESRASALREKMQQRVSLILQSSESFKPDFRSELELLGLVFG